MTGLLDGAIAVFLALIVSAVIVVQIRGRVSPGEASFLAGAYAYAVLIRGVLAVALNGLATNSAFAATFWGDSGTYDVFGYQLALKWSGEPVLAVYASRAVSGYGWVYFVAMVYTVLGRNQLAVQLLNGIVSGITVLAIYAIASRLFDRAAARYAALFMAFFPQMIFWSAGMYKDPAVLLCIALCMYAVLLLRERLSFGMIALFILAELALITLRFYIAYFVAFAALATFLFAQRRGALRSVLTFGLLAVLSLGALRLAVERETLESQASYLTLERLQTTREDQAAWGRSGFGQAYDVSTVSGAMLALPVGLMYLLFAPFPWAISGLRQALAAPETLVWYALMPAFARGVLHAVRTRFRAVLPILVFASTLTVAYAIMQGNVGTAYRQRTQVTMFFFIFMAVGLVERRRQRGASAVASPRTKHVA
jgi:4-amino-4-deoxy-L-arabinose transferase-like glycosyltransferase